MIAEIIAIGSELSCGSKLDTNSQWLSRELESLGWTVTRHTTLADDLKAIAAEIRDAAKRCGVLLITGGLGPTLDDLTRDALARAFSQPLVRDPQSEDHIRSLFVARGRAMPERNLRQAERPSGADVLLNRCGTAPGLLMRIPPESQHSDHPGCLIAVMPGVPAEMKPMFTEQVLPRLPVSDVVLRRKVLKTFGYGESEAERLLGDLTARGRNPEVGITASEAVISLWVTARATSAQEADDLCEQTCRRIRQCLGDAVYAEGDLELYDVTAELLHSLGRRVVLLEGTATGGLLTLWMTGNPRLESVTAGIEILSSPQSSERFRQPDSHASSSPCTSATTWEMEARSLVQRAADQYLTDCILLSSPFLDTVSENGVSLRRGFVSVAAGVRFETIDVSMSGNLAIFRQRAARTALNVLRLALLNPAN